MTKRPAEEEDSQGVEILEVVHLKKHQHAQLPDESEIVDLDNEPEDEPVVVVDLDSDSDSQALDAILEPDELDDYDDEDECEITGEATVEDHRMRLLPGEMPPCQDLSLTVLPPVNDWVEKTFVHAVVSPKMNGVSPLTNFVTYVNTPHTVAPDTYYIKIENAQIDVAKLKYYFQTIKDAKKVIYEGCSGCMRGAHTINRPEDHSPMCCFYVGGSGDDSEDSEDDSYYHRRNQWGKRSYGHTDYRMTTSTFFKLPVPLIYTDARGQPQTFNVMFFSPLAEALLGTEELNNLTARQFYEFVHPKKRPKPTPEVLARAETYFDWLVMRLAKSKLSLWLAVLSPGSGHLPSMSLSVLKAEREFTAKVSETRGISYY